MDGESEQISARSPEYVASGVGLRYFAGDSEFGVVVHPPGAVMILES